MTTRYKLLFLCMMVIALGFGFLGMLDPQEAYHFERLHIFLFNLCAGCTILLYYSEPGDSLSPNVRLFLFLSLLYALCAFLEIYAPVLVVTPALVAIVETIRIRRFSFFPVDFFKKTVPVSQKFHHAALLCLSIGMLIAALVIINSEYRQFITIPKLELNMFFLGYSFPLSLITMSLIFMIMEDSSGHDGALLFVTLGKNLQQKQFLISGMGFLMITSITGIVYILLEFTRGYDSSSLAWLMRLHSFTALYGWNLCGLAIICRYNDFPIQLHSNRTIALHWATVMILAPLGCYYPVIALIATIAYAVYLYIVLFSKPDGIATEQQG